ncbi:MAG: hypothetical protein Q8L64_06870 [bacterium]|nr:hypothetical protein [bacterium]
MFTFLPRGYREDTISEYRKRVLTVFVALCIVLAILSIALIMPTFVSLHFQRNQALDEKTRTENIQAGSVDAAAGAEITKLNERLVAVSEGADEKTMIALFERVLINDRSGISITAIGASRKDGSMSIRGIANTRETLVAFSQSLQGEPSFVSVDLPVSSLAKNRDISFAITIMLKQ